MLPSPGLIFSISESGQFKKCEFKACTIFFVLDVFFFLKVEDYVSSHSIAKNTFFFRVRAMFASRACRSSVMIGKALSKGRKSLFYIYLF